ncbi:MAG: TIGR04551 family protein [Cystobacterineae bacterium]|nr:TIGR04551 family protein [Cystobacterineae bacterium]
MKKALYPMPNPIRCLLLLSGLCGSGLCAFYAFPAWAQEAKTNPAKPPTPPPATTAAQAEPTSTASASTEPSSTASAPTEPSQAESSQAESTQAEPSQAESTQAESTSLLTAPPMAPALPSGLAASGEMEILRRELEEARQELSQLKTEVRAQLTTQSALQGWQEPWVEQKQKLKFLVMDGYFRVRPELFHQLTLGRAADPSGYTLFPTYKPGAQDKTFAGINMRMRMEPTFNITEQIRIRMLVDTFDNVMFGSTPDYAFSRNAANGYAWDRDVFGVFSNSQAPLNSGINSLGSSLVVKRAWGEISTPVGVFYFGRMPSNWGLGMLHNDGSCLDCNLGDTTDRLLFVVEPFAGWYAASLFEINVSGVSSSSGAGSGQPVGLSTKDTSYSVGAVLARKDTQSQRKAKLAAGESFWNYGVHFIYRSQRYDAVDYYGDAFSENGTSIAGFVPRKGQLFMPDIWLKYERPQFRLELEAAAVLGSIDNRAMTFADASVPGRNQPLKVVQFGAVLQGEYLFYKGDLSLKAELGFASGDKASGFGNHPRRKTAGANNTTQPGDIDGPQYACQDTGGCSDNAIRNFRFNREYAVDMLLFREIIGGVTDAFYIKPTVKYRIVDGFDIFGSMIYSRAIYGSSTPSATLGADGKVTGNAGLGIEFNVGARYESEGGFFMQLAWGILFPLAGFEDARKDGTQKAKTANALRGVVGIRF